jgi:hypothetical protein
MSRWLRVCKGSNPARRSTRRNLCAKVLAAAGQKFALAAVPGGVDCPVRPPGHKRVPPSARKQRSLAQRDSGVNAILHSPQGILQSADPG